MTILDEISLEVDSDDLLRRAHLTEVDPATISVYTLYRPYERLYR